MATQIEEPKRKGSNKKEQPEIVIEAAGNRHLAGLFWSKLVNAVTAPFRRASRRVREIALSAWVRVEPYKWRIVLTVVSLIVLTLVIGGLVSLWLWRDELARLVQTVWHKVSRSWPATASETVVAQAPVVSPNGGQTTVKKVVNTAAKTAKGSQLL